jgi:hypothetical protein
MRQPFCSSCSALLFVCGFVVPLWVAAPLRASESELEDAPPPETVKDIEGRVEKQFRPPAEPELFTVAPGLLDDLPPFLRDATYRVRLRSRYLNRRRFDDGRTETWAGGGSLAFRSGWWREMVAAELEYFTSQKLKGDKDRDGAKHLEPGQHGFGVLGIANLKLRWKEWTVTGYRQYLQLPYLNANDSRMVPNTFEAVTARYETDNLDFIGGHTWRIKLRDSDEFESYPETQGVDKDRGISFLALKANPTPSTYAGLFGYYGRDLGTVVYTEGSYVRELTSELEGRFEAQATRISTAGDALLDPGADFTSWFAGVRAAAGWRGWVVRLAATHMDDDGGIQGRFGSNPSYLDRMQHSFTRAGEEAVGVGVNYNLGECGLPGWGVHADVTQGWGAKDDTGHLGDRLETGVTLDYRPKEGKLFGFWFRLRGSMLYDDEEDRTQNELRVELQYEFDLF